MNRIRKRTVFGILMLLILVFTVPSWVNAVETQGEAMAKRGGRGVVNMTTFPLDILNSMEDVRFKNGILSALTYGLFKGIGVSTARFFYGLYEVGTFYDPYRNRNSFR